METKSTNTAFYENKNINNFNKNGKKQDQDGNGEGSELAHGPEVTQGSEVTHDFLSDRHWLTVLAGFSDSTSFPYMLYRLLLLGTMLYMMVMAGCACALDPSKRMIVEAVHFMLIALYIILWCLIMRPIIFSTLSQSRDFLVSGMHRYEGEEDDKELMKMKLGMPGEIRRKNNLFIGLFIAGGITNTTLFPVSQLLLIKEHDSSAVVNPYLPHLFYQPFNTRSTLGIVIGYLIGCVLYYTIYIISCAINSYYISGVVQMKVHFRILNHSLKNIEKRALIMYGKKFGARELSSEQLLQDMNYQECLYVSLRANIQHHQALLRLRNMFAPFSGYLALSVFSLSSMVYGCQLYLIYQENPINVAFNLFLAFAAEQFTVIFICFLGEDVFVESEKVLESLYSTRWYNFNKKFAQILQIMMTNTMKPTGVTALLFGVPASFETYGQVVSAMYKVMNLVRQSDLV